MLQKNIMHPPTGWHQILQSGKTVWVKVASDGSEHRICLGKIVEEVGQGFAVQIQTSLTGVGMSTRHVHDLEGPFDSLDQAKQAVDTYFTDQN